MKRDAFFSSWFLASSTALGIGLVIAASAAADTVTCAYFPGGGPLQLPPIVSAEATPTAGGAASMGRLGGGNDIIAQADNGTVDCGRATINNTDLIALGDASPQGAGDLHVFYVPVGATPYFAPGAANEPGSSDEIEFGAAFGGGKDTLGLDAAHGDGGAATIRLGTDGDHDYINLNAAETTGIDQDVSMEGVDRVHFQSNDAFDNDDDVRGIGGAGTGDSPLPIPITVYPGGGDDLAVGGSAGDLLAGDAGADTVIGKDGDDTLWGGIGADKLFGGKGPDDFDGNDGADTAYGGDAADIIHGNAGADDLKGGAGADELLGGPGFDTCVGGPGKDEFTGCEVVNQ
jgi:Ca2+-binding RTX toxin-like protein